MKQGKLTVIAALLFTLPYLAGCNTARKIDSTYANYSFATQCLGRDGEFQTLRVWGKGKNKTEALVAAQKKALRDVIFHGITAGNGDCLSRPLLPTANAEETHEKYFNEFFGKKGDWQNYVRLNEKRGSRKVSKNSEIENWETTVEIRVSQLEERLITDNILHK